MGAVFGFALAQVVASALAAIQLPIPMPVQLQVEPDGRVVIYAMLLGIASTVMTGLLPAWQSIRESIRADLQRDSRLRLRRGLVAVQLALSLVVLTTGALFVRNLLRSASMSPGFDVRHTTRADVHLPPEAYGKNARMQAYVRDGLQALRALPGVESAAAARIIPFTDATSLRINVTFAEPAKTRHCSSTGTPSQKITSTRWTFRCFRAVRSKPLRRVKRSR